MLVGGGTNKFVKWAAAQSITIWVLYIILWFVLSFIHLWLLIRSSGYSRFVVWIWTTVTGFQGKEVRVPGVDAHHARAFLSRALIGLSGAAGTLQPQQRAFEDDRSSPSQPRWRVQRQARYSGLAIARRNGDPRSTAGCDARGALARRSGGTGRDCTRSSRGNAAARCRAGPATIAGSPAILARLSRTRRRAVAGD